MILYPNYFTIACAHANKKQCASNAIAEIRRNSCHFFFLFILLVSVCLQVLFSIIIAGNESLVANMLSYTPTIAINIYIYICIRSATKKVIGNQTNRSMNGVHDKKHTFTSISQEPHSLKSNQKKYCAYLAKVTAQIIYANSVT